MPDADRDLHPTEGQLANPEPVGWVDDDLDGLRVNRPLGGEVRPVARVASGTGGEPEAAVEPGLALGLAHLTGLVRVRQGAQGDRRTWGGVAGQVARQPHAVPEADGAARRLELEPRA